MNHGDGLRESSRKTMTVPFQQRFTVSDGGYVTKRHEHNEVIRYKVSHFVQFRTRNGKGTFSPKKEVHHTWTRAFGDRKVAKSALSIVCQKLNQKYGKEALEYPLEPMYARAYWLQQDPETWWTTIAAAFTGKRKCVVCDTKYLGGCQLLTPNHFVTPDNCYENDRFKTSIQYKHRSRITHWDVRRHDYPKKLDKVCHESLMYGHYHWHDYRDVGCKLIIYQGLRLDRMEWEIISHVDGQLSKIRMLKQRGVNSITMIRTWCFPGPPTLIRDKIDDLTKGVATGFMYMVACGYVPTTEEGYESLLSLDIPPIFEKSLWEQDIFLHSDRCLSPNSLIVKPVLYFKHLGARRTEGLNFGELSDE
jgi:hypothetical protein